MNKCFLLNPEKKLGKSVSSFSRKTQKNAPLIPKNDVTEPKTKRLCYSNNQLNSCKQVKNSFRLPKTMVSGSLKLSCNLLTV